MTNRYRFAICFALCAVFIFLAALLSHGQDKAVPGTPALTTEQKFQVRDLQAKDGEVTAAILQMQLQATQRLQQLTEQKTTYESQLQNLLSGLCKTDGEKKYQVNTSDLTCVPEQPKPEKK